MYILAFQQQWHSTCPQGRRLSTRLDAIGGGPEWNAPSDLKSDLTETSLRIRSCLAVIGFEQNHAPAVTQDESSTPVRALPFDAIATILGDRGLMGGLAFLDPTDDVAFGCIGGIPGGQSSSRCPPEPSYIAAWSPSQPRASSRPWFKLLNWQPKRTAMPASPTLSRLTCCQSPGKVSGRSICTGRSRHSQHFFGCITCALLTGG